MRTRLDRLQAVDPGPDRAARTVQVGLRTEFDVFTDWWVQAAFREGLMWQADMHQAASMAAHRTQVRMSTIETSGEEVVADNTSRVVLDAIFRETLLWAEECPQLHPFIDRLASGLEETTDDDTSTRRLAALTKFFRATADLFPEPTPIHLHFERFESACMAEYRFSPEDYDALSSFKS